MVKASEIPVTTSIQLPAVWFSLEKSCGHRTLQNAAGNDNCRRNGSVVVLRHRNVNLVVPEQDLRERIAIGKAVVVVSVEQAEYRSSPQLRRAEPCTFSSV